ncbi:hypothetical protein WAI453_009699 [Rhynchosporium graminicola]
MRGRGAIVYLSSANLYLLSAETIPAIIPSHSISDNPGLYSVILIISAKSSII